VNHNNPTDSQCPAYTKNCFRNPGDTLDPDPSKGFDNHATANASILASNNADFPGIAPGVKLHSANIKFGNHGDGILPYQQDVVDALAWALVPTRGTDIVNVSYSNPK
jgi:hypothetical protein